jgi:hypothetical protein
MTTCIYPQTIKTQKSYAYLLGLYLGDGYINLQNEKYGVYKLRITQDLKYPNLMSEHRQAMEVVFPNNKSNICKHTNSNCCDVYIYNKNMIDMFPQHGVGRKHTRKIQLTEWQRDIVTKYSKQFIRGLVQSDGCRYIQKQNKREYLKYNFTNSSKDIIDLFCWACDNLKIHWTIHSRQSEDRKKNKLNTTKYIVTFNRRDAVELLEQFVGQKT